MTDKKTPFEIVSALCDKTLGRIDTGEYGYDAFVVNRALSNVYDTVLFANEMNGAFNLPKQMQCDFYFYGLDKRKRYGKWYKNQDNEKNLELIQEYLGCSRGKAKEVEDILIPHLNDIRKSLYKGGQDGNKRRLS